MSLEFPSQLEIELNNMIEARAQELLAVDRQYHQNSVSDIGRARAILVLSVAEMCLKYLKMPEVTENLSEDELASVKATISELLS